MKRKLVKQMQSLIGEGEKFTFNNFCYPNKTDASKYAGEEKPDWIVWKTRSYNLLTKVSAPDSSVATLAEEAVAIPTTGNYHENFERLKATMIKALELAIENIRKDSFGELVKQKSKTSSILYSNKIFVVHGHDHTLKTELENFLISLGLEPIVLHKQPDEGQTLIEKFEKHSDAGYAFILLTPDEVTYTVDQENINDKQRKKEKRARPNVIFEFGYFAGRLGRNRVCCLYKGDVALPSDLQGLLYKKVDQSVESIGYLLIKELKAAGYKIQIK